ncbi:MAG: DUF4330 family protein [Clostridia bacterium]|nr:DUF4330 family protein [Clostridia bacterium]
MRGNEGRRGSVADLLLVLLLLAVVAGAALRLIDRNADGESRNEEAELVLSIESLSAPIADYLTAGDVLYTTDGTLFGELIAMESTPARVVLEQNGAFFVGTADDERVDLRLSVRVQGVRNGNLFLLNGRISLPIGKVLTLYTDRVALHATIVRWNALTV